ncbi:MAG TPA: Rieske 2Fe-2S domain-containing protein [Flavisolibacter sp.]|nr:Rieske 2Fe-2S domain-containing protein [Flavisolibacter sp.]
MNHNKKYTWHKVADEENELGFGADNLARLTVAQKDVCFAKGKNTLYACAPKCPHAGGIMADGFIDALSNIVCPLHKYKFSLQTGRNVSGEGYHLKTYPVLKTEDGIFIGFEEGLFSL